MERKKIQRMIGIVVIMALVVIVIPLLFGRNDGPLQEAANIKAPPFPDQHPTATVVAEPVVSAENNAANPEQNTVANADNDPMVTPINQPVVAAEKIATATIGGDTAPTPVVSESTATPAPVAANSAEAASTDSSNTVQITQDVAKTLNSPQASIIYERPKTTEQPLPEANEKTATAEIHAEDGITNEATSTEIRKADNQTIPTLKVKPAVLQGKHKPKAVKSIFANKKKPQTIEQLSQLKTAWAIQMGSFKVKKNAINLANKLRAAGYKAFTRDIKSDNGHASTRVYIGPEFKQASAARLSSDIQHHLSIQGIIIPYKPLEI
jgi:DedD protein